MFRFFRKTRSDLMEKNKTGNYLKYAIGEIVLVVIGILIALQINNWNQDRLASIEEHNIYKNLNAEFKANKVQLQKGIDRNNNSMAVGRILMDLVGSDKTIIEAKNVDSLIFQFFEMSSAKFSENTIFEIIQSGKMQYIQNDSIKNLILEWTQQKEEVVLNNTSVRRVQNLIVEYLYKKYPLKNIDIYGPLKWKAPSKLKVDKLPIFNDIEFESLMDDYMFNINGFISQEKVSLKIIEKIIKATEPYDH